MREVKDVFKNEREKEDRKARWQEEIDRQTHLKRNCFEPGAPVNLETHLFGRKGASHFWQKGRELHGRELQNMGSGDASCSKL